MRIQISKIIFDHQTQPRQELNSETISEYAELMRSGVKFPPVTLFKNGKGYYLADGWHRVKGATAAGYEDIEADVKTGNIRDAILFSAGANASHGLHRSNADKRRAVLSLLNDEEWRKWSDREIGRRCCVNHHFVSQLRKTNITGRTPSDPAPRTYTDRWGNQAQMNTGAINESRADDALLFDDAPVTMKSVQQETKPKEPAKSTFNQTNDNIEWAKWSWNPVTGCEHDCEYCYARDIANRFYPEKFKPTFHPERLDAPKNTNPRIGEPGGCNVFVCSMADLFGSWVPNEWITKVMKSVEENPQWNFLFLTKNPRRLASVQFPDNAWVGTTVDTQKRVKAAENYMSKVEASVKFVSVEPMLEEIQFENIKIFDWIIIGGQSQSTQAQASQPEWEWVWNLTAAARKAKVKVYWKPNLEVRPKEYPCEANRG